MNSTCSSDQKGPEHTGAFAGLATDALLLFAVVALADLLARIAAGWPMRADTTIPEGSIIYSVQQLLGEGSLYRDFNRPPYATTAYTPLLYLLTASVAWLFGGSHPDVETLYRCGRTVVLFAAGGALWCVWWLSRFVGPGRLRWLAPLSVAWFGQLYPWVCTTRPDALAVALSLAAVCIVARDNSVSWRSVTVAAFVSAMAMVAKQSSLAAPVAITLYLLWSSRMALAVAFAVTFGSLTALAFGLFQVIWPHFWANVFGANVAPTMLARSAILTAWYGYHAWPLLGLGVVGWVCAFRSSQPRVRLLQLHAMLALAAGVAMSVKAGAALNYFLEATFALAVFAPRGPAAAERWSLPFAGLKWAFVLATGFFVLFRTLDRWLYPPPVVSTQEVLTKAEAYGRPALFQDSGLAIRFGTPILLLDSFNASYLADRGVLNIEPLARELHEQSVAVVVLSQESPYASVWEVSWLPTPVAREIAAHYELADYVEPSGWFYLPSEPRDRGVPCHFRGRGVGNAQNQDSRESGTSRATVSPASSER